MIKTSHIPDPEGWIVLRCAGGSTSKLATFLTRACHFESWTPLETQQRRRNGSRLPQAMEVPVMPTFVFSRQVHKAGLLELSHRSVIGCPAFSVFHYLTEIPVIADVDLAALRAYEARGRRRNRGKPKGFEEGDQVRLTQGAYAGMNGVVVEPSKGKFTLVCFGGRVNLKIDSFLLRTDMAKGDEH